MGFANTAKKVQQLGDLAEKLYRMVNEVLERTDDLQERVQQSTEDVKAVRREQRRQRAILEALAEQRDVDVEAVLAAADVEPENVDDAPAGAEGAGDGAEDPTEGPDDSGDGADDTAEGGQAGADADAGATDGSDPAE